VREKAACGTSAPDIKLRGTHFPLSGLLGLLLAVLLGACSSTGTSGPPTELGTGGVPVAVEARPAASAAEAELLEFVATASPGSHGTILSEQDGMLEAAVGSEYVSARGRLCRHLSIWRGNASQASERIACQSENGWELIRPLRGVASR